MTAALLVLSLLLLLLPSGLAYSCATCGYGQSSSTGAFILTTGIMTSVPLLAFGGIAYWIYRKHQKARQISTPETKL